MPPKLPAFKEQPPQLFDGTDTIHVPALTNAEAQGVVADAQTEASRPKRAVLGSRALIGADLDARLTPTVEPTTPPDYGTQGLSTASQAIRKRADDSAERADYYRNL